MVQALTHLSNLFIKKINLPIKQIDKKENWRRIIDLKIIVDGYIGHN